MKRAWLVCWLAACGGQAPSVSSNVSHAPNSDPVEDPAFDCAAPMQRSSAPAEQVRREIEQCGLADTIELTRELVRFPTVASELPKSRPAFEAMAAYIERYARESGMSFRVVGDHDAWVVELGSGEPAIGFVMHGDVVPPGDSGWTRPPFEAKLIGDRLYGRGTEDDKAPIAAVLVATRALSGAGYTPRGKIQAIIGTAEEHEWDGMERYAEREKHPRHVISIDASYPLVIAESGFVRWQLAMRVKGEKGGAPGCLPVLGVAGGEFLTQVPGSASLELGPPEGGGDARAAVAERLGTLPGIVVTGDAHAAKVSATGKAVHSSVAEQGDNALWRLSAAATKLALCPGGAASMLELVRERFAGDNWGQKLGLAYRHPLMGRLLVAPTVLRVEEGEVRLSINMRRPAGMDKDTFSHALDQALARLQRRYVGLVEPKKGRYVGDAALADTSGKLVPTLVDIYRELSGDRVSQPISIRGGTYARLFPGAVSFGPALPGHEYRGHAPDEYITVDAMQLVVRAAVEAMLRLDAADKPL